MSHSTKQFGDKGEDLAAEFLEEKGYEIITRNYRYGKGEIDIIAKDPETAFTVFIEVKSRKNFQYGHPAYAVTKGKMNQIKKIAELYLYEKEIKELDCRFDVITIIERQNLKPIIEHFENAFM